MILNLTLLGLVIRSYCNERNAILIKWLFLIFLRLFLSFLIYFYYTHTINLKPIYHSKIYNEDRTPALRETALKL